MLSKKCRQFGFRLKMGILIVSRRYTFLAATIKSVITEYAKLTSHSSNIPR